MGFGVVTAILYCLQFSRELDDEQVERISRMILEQPIYDLTTQEQYEEIEAACAADVWGKDLSWQPHGEPSVRDFLRRVVERLDGLRPWLEPPYRSLGVGRWEDFKRGTLLAHVRMGSMAQDPLHVRLRPVPGDEHQLRGLVLRLRSGDEVALVAPPLSNTNDAVLMAVPPHRPAHEVIKAFVTHTGHPREQVSPTARRRWWGKRGGGALPPGLESLGG